MRARTLSFPFAQQALLTALVAATMAATAHAVPCPDPTSVTISPSSQNVPEATVDVNNVKTPTLVTLSGSVSGTATSYLWTQTNGPTVTINNPDQLVATFTAPDVGPNPSSGTNLKFKLTATNAPGGCSPVGKKDADTNINVTNVVVNLPPVAALVANPASINEGGTVTLNANGSSDPNGDALDYTWIQTGGTPVTLNISGGGNGSTTGKTATFVAPNNAFPSGETLTFQVTVSDGSLDDDATVTVNVVWVNDAPVSVLSCTPSVGEGGQITLDASGSTDTENQIVSYAWQQTLGPPNVGVVFPATPMVQFNAPALGFGHTGELRFSVLVTDAGNLSSLSICTVQVNDVTGPVLSGLTNLTVDATSDAGATVSFSPTAYDAVEGARPVSCVAASGSLFPIGTTTVNCTSSDSKGNEGSGSFTVTVVDTIKPTIAPHADVTVEATSASGATGNYVLPTVSDNVSTGLVASCTPVSGSNFPLGDTTVNCSATDVAGNIGTSSFLVHVVDTTPPTIAAHGDVTVEATSSAGAVVTYDAPATSDIVDGAGTATCAPASGTTFAIGTTAVNCNKTDAHGNAATATTFNVIVQDKTPPTIASHGDVTAEATSAAGAVVTYSSPATSDAVDGAGVATCTPASGSTFPLGSTQVTCTATDAHGNAATPTTFNVIVQDTTPPVIAAHGDETAEATSSSGATVSYSAPATSDAVDGPGTATCTPVSGSMFALGDTTVTCTAKDAKNNIATPKTFKVKVVDTTAPVIAGHADVTAEATSGAGATVAYSASATSDAVDGPGTATCAPASGTVFALGSTTVTCNATDVAGNAATATSFKVNVVDTTPPVIGAHADVTAEATSAAGASVGYAAPGTTDAVDGPGTATCTPVAGSLFPLGNTTVTCTAKDAHNNSAVATTFKVIVVDTTAPVLTVPGNIVKEATGPSGAVATFAATATDAVTASPIIVCTPASGSTFPLGTTTVNCSATDAAGNSSPGSFTVKVQDTTPPAIAAHADVSAFATSSLGAAVTYTSPTATDIVSGAVAVTCLPASGSTFPVGESTVNCSAVDGAGNGATSSFKVNVSYNFNGFFQPINNSTANSVKAGSAIPVKFSLGGNMGLGIMAAGYPMVKQASCTWSADPIEDTETVTAGGSSLNYDAAANQYVYVWKTEKSWANNCLQLQVKLKDGSVHTALFEFKK